MSYYYFGATLPTLSPTGTPPWTVAAFVDEADRQLLPADRRELALVLAGGGSSAFARASRTQAQQLALAIARLRAERRGLDPTALDDDGADDLQLRAAVAEAFAAPHPLERQRRLDGLQWRWFERATSDDPFGLAAVLAHGRMLQLAWQWHARTAVAGNEALAGQRQRLLAGFGEMQLTMTGAEDEDTTA